MARARILKAKFFTNELLGHLPPLARLLFAGLWTIADRAGRLEDRPERIHAELLPYDRDADIDALLSMLAETGFITRYEAEGKRCIEIGTWSRHQHPHPHEPESEIPSRDHQAIRKQSRDINKPCHDIGKPCPTNGEPCKAGSSVSSVSTKKNKTIARVPRAAPRFDARAYLFSAGIDSGIAADWLTLRKAKKASVTETAIKGIEREAKKAGMALEDALRISCERGWTGFRASWLESEQRNATGPPGARHTHNGAPPDTLDGRALDALARGLGVDPARPGESMEAFKGRIKAAQRRRDQLH